MTNYRHHGIPPYAVAVIHGGPGAPGEMAPAARELASVRGVIEPLQTATTLQGQVDELNTVLCDHATPPVTLIGFSWGAWLSFIVAAGQPALVSKLILVSSGPFEESYAAAIMETRLSRLTTSECDRALSLLKSLEQGLAGDNTQLAEFGALMSQADTYHAIADQSEEAEPVACCADTFRTVWTEAAEMRRSGRLLELGRQITCPVLAIHGDYDPHPAEGVLKPLSGAVRDFRFALLDHCGHKPWIEQEARGRFFEILAQELA